MGIDLFIGHDKRVSDLSCLKQEIMENFRSKIDLKGQFLTGVYLAKSRIRVFLKRFGYKIRSAKDFAWDGSRFLASEQGLRGKDLEFLY